MTSRERSDIVVVDDQPANLMFLESMLKQQGYTVRLFSEGRQAFAAAADHTPDLFLLDIAMPGMSGFELCERLKSDEKLRSIPVIFLSALAEKEDKLRAFQVGGVDYVTKPFQLEEVRARVETHLEFHRLQRALKDQNDHLEEMVRLRTRELAEAHERLKILDRSKSDFLNLISHELRTPLAGLLGVGEILLEESQSISDDDQLREAFEVSRRRIMTILDHALLLTQIDVEGEKFASERAGLSAVLSLALEHAAEFAQARKVTMDAGPVPTVMVVGAANLLQKAFQALLETAAKLSEPGETIRINCESLPGAIRVTIKTRGRTIPPDAIPKFFELFSVGEVITPGDDLGLDPPVADRIISLFGGSISIENQHPAGTKMVVSLRPSAE